MPPEVALWIRACSLSLSLSLSVNVHVYFLTKRQYIIFVNCRDESKSHREVWWRWWWWWWRTFIWPSAEALCCNSGWWWSSISWQGYIQKDLQKELDGSGEMKMCDCLNKKKRRTRWIKGLMFWKPNIVYTFRKINQLVTLGLSR